jgi:hypothetical protein
MQNWYGLLLCANRHVCRLLALHIFDAQQEEEVLRAAQGHPLHLLLRQPREPHAAGLHPPGLGNADHTRGPKGCE